MLSRIKRRRALFHDNVKLRPRTTYRPEDSKITQHARGAGGQTSRLGRLRCQIEGKHLQIVGRAPAWSRHCARCGSKLEWG